MKAYSIDLRQKVVDAYACGDISQRKLAKNFGVTLSFVQNLLKRHRELGTINAKVRTEQTPTKLNAEQIEILGQLVVAQPDATLRELRERLYEKTEVLIGVATVNRMVRRKLNLNLKKKSPPHEKGHLGSPIGQIWVLETLEGDTRGKSDFLRWIGG